MFPTSLLTALAAVLLVQQAAAATGPAFVGCYAKGGNGLPLGAGLVSSASTQALCDDGVYSLVVEQVAVSPPDQFRQGGSRGMDQTACATNNAFSFFLPENRACYCSNTPPSASKLVTAASVTACQTNQFTANKLSTSYIFQQCAATMTYWDTPTKSKQADVYACMKECAANNNAQFWVFAVFYPSGAPVAGTNCYCSTSTSYTPVTCGVNTAYNYNLERLATVSWKVKRQADEREKKKSLGLCPYPMSACAIGPGEDGFECLDTSKELESCGGCRHGALAINETAPATGLDCSALPGVAAGAVSCVDSKCKVYACRPGYTLIKGYCVPS